MAAAVPCSLCFSPSAGRISKISKPSSRKLLTSMATISRSDSVAAVVSSVPITGEKKREGEAEPKISMQEVAKVFDETIVEPRGLADFIEQSKELIKHDGGVPRWLSPLDCGGVDRRIDSPPLFFLPGIDGVGLGLIRHHQRLGKIFDVWCLHVPVMDRTPFEGIVGYVERTIKSENHCFPKMPIYLVGESLGACIALAVAARNPDIDFVLILANPATSFFKSQLQYLSSFVDIIPEPLHITIPYCLDFFSGKTLRMSSAFVEDVLSIQQTVGGLSESLNKLLPSLSDGSIDVVTVIKGSGFYRRLRLKDHVSDYLPPTPYEFQKISEQYRWIEMATCPVMLSTLDDGQIVNGLAGIPSNGPVILVGYHMLLGFELGPMFIRFIGEKNIHLRGVGHPFLFNRNSEMLMFNSSSFDGARTMGAVPVSGTSIYKLLSQKSFVLLYPGGAREALHKKGEAYKLFWPERTEFVRMASKFGATIIPFGVVGEDDILELLLDYNDIIKIPFYDLLDKRINQKAVRLRANSDGEVGNQDLYVPGLLPKIPGRFYYLFGKPILTRGNKELGRDREKAQKMYLHVKSEVENCIAYLKEKREQDPFRSIVPRLLYQASRGFTGEVPTFEL